MTAIPCPACGREAERAPFYASVYLIGDTVAKGTVRASREGNVKDGHGRYRVSLFQEAAAEVDYAHTRAEQNVGHELPPPDLYKIALRRARSAAAGVSSLAADS